MLALLPFKIRTDDFHRLPNYSFLAKQHARLSRQDSQPHRRLACQMPANPLGRQDAGQLFFE